MSYVDMNDVLNHWTETEIKDLYAEPEPEEEPFKVEKNKINICPVCGSRTPTDSTWSGPCSEQCRMVRSWIYSEKSPQRQRTAKLAELYDQGYDAVTLHKKYGYANSPANVLHNVRRYKESREKNLLMVDEVNNTRKENGLKPDVISHFWKK